MANSTDGPKGSVYRAHRDDVARRAATAIDWDALRDLPAHVEQKPLKPSWEIMRYAGEIEFASHYGQPVSREDREMLAAWDYQRGIWYE